MNLLKSTTIEHRCFCMKYLRFINPYQLPLSFQIITPMFFFLRPKKLHAMFFMPLGFFLLSREEDWSWTAPQLDELCICLGVHEVPTPKERQTSQKRHRRTRGRWGGRDECCFSEYFKTSVGRPYLKDQGLINYSELIMLVLLFSLLFESGFIDYFEVLRSCSNAIMFGFVKFSRQR